jgi:NAD(P) transhydrogenase
VRAKVVLIATGSRPSCPTEHFLRYSGSLRYRYHPYRGRVPKDILIVGGGAVGVEFATICHALRAQR